MRIPFLSLYQILYISLFMVIFTLFGGQMVQTARAEHVKIIQAEIEQTPQGTYDIHVTLEHADTGWDHYANEWRIVDENGQILGRRILAHPHVNEQPFTRSLRNISLNPALKTVYIQARDSIHNWSPIEFVLHIPQ